MFLEIISVEVLKFVYLIVFLKIMFDGMKIINVGDFFYLYCKIVGYFILLVVWKKNGRSFFEFLFCVMFLLYGGFDNGYFVVFDVFGSEVGEYMCEVMFSYFSLVLLCL